MPHAKVAKCAKGKIIFFYGSCYSPGAGFGISLIAYISSIASIF